MNRKFPNQHVVPNDGTWQLKEEGNPVPLCTASTQRDVINFAIPLARENGVELAIHRPNGRIREKYSYGNDPYPPKG